jgi:hypothetical protein
MEDWSALFAVRPPQLPAAGIMVRGTVQDGLKKFKFPFSPLHFFFLARYTKSDRLPGSASGDVSS